MKKKYSVTLYYRTCIEVEVVAENEQEAIGNAYAEAGKSEYDRKALNNMESNGDPDVEEI